MNTATTFSEGGEGGGEMAATTRLRKRIAIVVMAAAIVLAAAACAPPAPPDASGAPSDPYVNALLQAMNQDRANAGLPPLGNSPKLQNLAATWSQQMSMDGYLHHQDLSSILYSGNYPEFHTLGENVIEAPGSFSAQQLEAAWMNSPPHRANILNGGYNTVGLGTFQGSDGQLWSTADFGG